MMPPALTGTEMRCRVKFCIPSDLARAHELAGSHARKAQQIPEGDITSAPAAI